MTRTKIQCFKEWYLHEYIGKDKLIELSQSKAGGKDAEKRIFIQNIIKQIRHE